MQELEPEMNQQVHERNESLRSLESLITESQKMTENRMDQTDEAIRQTQQRTDVMFQHCRDWPRRGPTDEWEDKTNK